MAALTVIFGSQLPSSWELTPFFNTDCTTPRPVGYNRRNEVPNYISPGKDQHCVLCAIAIQSMQRIWTNTIDEWK